MKRFCFVGGPKLDQYDEFFRCPRLVGRIPSAWSIYPSDLNDGKDSTVAKFEPQGIVWSLLLHLNSAAEWSQIVLVGERVQ